MTTAVRENLVFRSPEFHLFLTTGVLWLVNSSRQPIPIGHVLALGGVHAVGACVLSILRSDGDTEHTGLAGRVQKILEAAYSNPLLTGLVTVGGYFSFRILRS